MSDVGAPGTVGVATGLGGCACRVRLRAAAAAASAAGIVGTADGAGDGVLVELSVRILSCGELDERPPGTGEPGAMLTAWPVRRPTTSTTSLRAPLTKSTTRWWLAYVTSCPLTARIRSPGNSPAA